MSRFLLTIKYLGTHFCGWQVQPNGITVQEVMCNTLKSIFKTDISVTGCSRTDSGVHALMYCCHFDADTSMGNENIIKALNSNLPASVVCIDCKKVSDDFHARYNSTGKNYIYRIYNAPIREPFLEDRALWCTQALDINRMETAAKLFLGKHDFTAFCSSGSSVENKVRTVTECKITKENEMIEISVSADGFLYNMVRIIVGTLIEIGSGTREVESIEKAFETNNREFAGRTVAPHGLYLNKVFYGEQKNG